MMRLTLLLIVIFTETSAKDQDDLRIQLRTAVAGNNSLDIIALAKEGGNVNGTTESGDTLVHLAVKTGSKSSIAALGFLKADLEALNEAGATPMEEAIKVDNAASVKELILAGAKIEKRLFRGDTYLHIAAAENRNKALQTLIEEGHEIDIKNYLGETPLGLALRVGNAKGVSILLESGADVKLVSELGKGPLETAVESGDVDSFKVFVKSGFPTDLRYETNDTLIHLIVRSSNTSAILKVLNGRKPLLNSKNDDGLAPLHVATDPSVVRTLLDMGADVNITTEENETALHLASANGSQEVVRALVQRNAGVNLKDSKGNTALINAVKNSKLHVVIFLLFNAADPRIKNNFGWTALHYAAEGGYCKVIALLCVEVVNVLLDAGAIVNDQDIDGFTPAFIAAINDKVTILQTLGRRGADLNLKGKRGAGIIHEAAFRGHVEIVSYLLHEGVNVNSKDLENGWTALHYAVQVGRKNVVTILLDNEADPKPTAVDGRTPLQLAFEHRRLVVAKLLIERGA